MFYSTAIDRAGFIQDNEINYQIYFETIRMQAIVWSSWYVGTVSFRRKRKGIKETRQTTWGQLYIIDEIRDYSHNSDSFICTK